MKNTKTLVERIKIFWYKYILRHKYFIGVDYGDKDISCTTICRVNRKGEIIIENISYEK